MDGAGDAGHERPPGERCSKGQQVLLAHQMGGGGIQEDLSWCHPHGP